MERKTEKKLKVWFQEFDGFFDAFLNILFVCSDWLASDVTVDDGCIKKMRLNFLSVLKPLS
jgi:uncharacterized membrane protein